MDKCQNFEVLYFARNWLKSIPISKTNALDILSTKYDSFKRFKSFLRLTPLSFWTMIFKIKIISKKKRQLRMFYRAVLCAPKDRDNSTTRKSVDQKKKKKPSMENQRVPRNLKENFEKKFFSERLQGRFPISGRRPFRAMYTACGVIRAKPMK